MSVIPPLPPLLLPAELLPAGADNAIFSPEPTGLQPLELKLAAENAFILYTGAQQIHPCNAATVQQCCALLQPLLGQDIVELLPSYASVLILFNPLRHSHLSLLPLLQQALLQSSPATQALSSGKLVELPVWYSEQSGADLLSVAKTKNLTPDEVIRLHSNQSYQVYAIGFAPGFAYLGELPAELAMPRLSSPRAKVPAGAVAIADRQTAVYPAASPGGWHLLGLCPIRMFNPRQEPAMPVAVGDQVRFVPVSEREFQLLGGAL